MAEASKILTVSYGTFSCTLEGFDDAFDTMKAIAEYFRDLAADDRYFGAEPPTPDPEMLARIAEREVERRVEARLERGAYVLRPAALTTAAGAAAAGLSGLAPWPRPDADRPEEPTAPIQSDNRPETETPETPEAPAGTPAEDAAGQRTAAEAPEEEPTQGSAESDADATASAMESDDIGSTDVTQSATEDQDRDVTASDDDGTTVKAEDEGAAEAGAESADHTEMQSDAPVRDDAESAQDATAAAGAEAVPAEESASGDDADPIETKPWDDLTAEERREFRRRRRAERAERAAARANDDKVEEEPTEDAGPDDAVTAEAAQDAETADPEDDPKTETGPEAAADSDTPDVEDDSVVAKLARIRAVVGSGAAGAVGAAVLAAGDDTEDDPAPGPSPVADQDLDALRSMIRQDEESAGSETKTAPSGETPELDAGLTDDETASRPSEEAAAAPIRARVVKMRRSDFEARYGEAELAADESAPPPVTKVDDTEAGPPGDMAGTMDLARMDGLQDESGDTTAADTETETEVELADLARLDGLEEYEAPAPEVAGPSSSLSPDAEAELMEELAEVERMALAEDAEPESEAPPSAASGMSGVTPDMDAGAGTGEHARESRATLLATPPEADEAAMSRILTETDAQFNEPEASRRREAIAHLKAAVAATEAARQLGEAGKDTDDDGENMFRDDLDQVVRPRRTPRPLTRSERPRPAPLKLVASQRVDAPPAAAAAAPESRPVLPRRVETGAAVPDAAEAAAQDRFARFASDMGTAGLSDMIEAAAAHAMFNEGEEDVSRPQLMRMVQAIVPGDFSREDGLRAFGTLLRQGRLEKVRNGRFRVSPQTRFNPRRAASGS